MRRLSILIAASLFSAGAFSQQAPEPFTNNILNSHDVIQITENGRYIADTYGALLNIHDRKTDQTEQDFQGSISDNGAYIAYSKPRNSDEPFGPFDVYLKNRETGESQKISVPTGSGEVANGTSVKPGISRSGDYVVFVSTADNLTDEDVIPESEGTGHVYMYERDTGEISFIGSHYRGFSSGMVASLRGSIPEVTPNGDFVLYDSALTGIPSILVNTNTGEKSLIETETGNVTYRVSSELSNDGRFALIQHGHTNEAEELHLYDRKTGSAKLLSVATDGSNDPVIVSRRNTFSSQYAMSGDARYIAFASSDYGITESADNGQIDVFVFDRDKHKVARVNVDSENNRLDPKRINITISSDGHYVTFSNYVVANPLYEAGYCEGYEPFDA